MNQNQALFEYLLRLGDSDMVLAQRLCELVGKAPALEEEMAIGNVALTQSSDERIVAIAAKGLKEVTYHLRRSGNWIKRLGDGTEESHTKMQEAIDEIWTYAGEMFIADEVDSLLADAGVAPDLDALQQKWQQDLTATLEEATLTCPPMDAFMQTGSKQGMHTEQLGYLLAEMQFLPRSFPGASW
jgi:ring-1,2-phenylacetyl-CoA epoxidase subunit PaaC